MSWLFSQALVEEYSEACSVDFAQFVQSKSTPMPQAFWYSDKTMVFSNLSRYGMTFGVLMGSLGTVLLMWYLGGFRAKTYQKRETELDSMESAVVYGKKCYESFARYDHHSHSWRTAQCSLFGGLTEYSDSLPKSGTMLNGELLDAEALEQPMTAKERGCWLGTPTATMSIRSKKFLEGSDRLPTPAEVVGGKPNPVWIEAVMGWPLHWTEITPLEMDKFQQWCERHGTSCAKEPPQDTMETGQNIGQQRQYAIPLDIKE
jgi:hypothetical protein